MKSKTHILFVCFLFPLQLFFNCSSNESENPKFGNSISVKTFGGTNNEGANSVISTTDGGFAVLGYVQSLDGDVTGKSDSSYDYWVLKFDANANLQWNKALGGSNDDRGREIIQTSDGGYAVLGFSTSSDLDVSENSGAQDYWLAKLDSSGSIIWEKSLGFSGNDSGISLLQTNDNGYLLMGILDVTASGGEGNYNRSSRHAGGDYWAIKLDFNGVLLWSRYYGGTFTDTPYDVIETQDDGFLIVGSSDSNDVDITANKGSYDFWVVKISSTGDMIWEKSYGGSEIDEAHAIIESGDGNYLIVGDTRSTNLDVSQNNGAADLWLIKITPSGDLLWEKTFGGSSFDVGRSIVKAQGNDYFIAGSSRSIDGDLTENKGQNDAWIIRIDTNSEIDWQQTFGGSEVDFAYSITQLNDGTIIAVGDSNSSDGDVLENKGFTDVLILQIK
ncbi:MAG TPA: hypothetical protein VKN14_05750 [Flavobacteriaceae bacterium]|nr:hypothetical protein [Flavobacteriaceae bacterium]